jgi:DNA invertase Pin-like site-specific DNA recombinase
MDALAYLRLPGERRGQSIRSSGKAGQDQREETDDSLLASLEAAAQDAGYELERIFTDTTDRLRPAFEALLQYFREPPHRFRVLFTPSWQHLAEEPLTAAERVLEVEGQGVAVRSVADGDPLQAALAAWGVLHSQRGATVRRGMERRAVQGMGLGRPPHGYRIGESGHFEVVEEEARTVRLIYRLYLRSRLGLRLIAAQLNDEGRETRRGRPWSIVSIRAILRNRAYLGTYDRFGFRVPGAHPAVISPEEYRLAQQRLGRFDLGGIAPQPSLFLLSDLLRCGSCGNTMMGVSRRQRWQRRNGEKRENLYRYYQCQSRRNLSLCQYGTQQAPLLEAMVLNALRRLEGELPVAAVRAGPVIGKRERQELLRAAAEGLVSLTDLRARAHEWFQPSGSTSSSRSWKDELARWESLPFAHQRALLVSAVETIVVRENDVELTFRPSFSSRSA